MTTYNLIFTDVMVKQDACLYFYRRAGDSGAMVRKLRYHEKKLLKKFDFINWPVDNNLHELAIIKKFYIQKREDYTVYAHLSNLTLV